MRPKPKCKICTHLINIKNDERPIQQIQTKAVYDVLAAQQDADKLRVHWACAKNPHKHGWMEVGSVEFKHDFHICCDLCCAHHFVTH